MGEADSLTERNRFFLGLSPPCWGRLVSGLVSGIWEAQACRQ